ncbi:hypothetical protein HK101_002022, partial [Irineochytrium annulatum]
MPILTKTGNIPEAKGLVLDASELPPETEVFLIPYTGEIFINYDDYFARIGIYKKPLWSCSVTGAPGYTYKDAMAAELHARRESVSKLPEPWRQDALRLIHYNPNTLTVVESQLIDHFRDRIYPNELVSIVVDGDEVPGVVTQILAADGAPDPAAHDTAQHPPLFEGRSYVVHLCDEHGELLKSRRAADGYGGSDNDDDEEESESRRVRFKVAGEEVRRNRYWLLKPNVKNFVKDCATKESWSGAPWYVRADLVKMFKLPTTPPKGLPLTLEEKKKADIEAAKLRKKLEKLAPPPPPAPKPMKPPPVLKLKIKPQFPMEDLELIAKAPRPPKERNGRLIPPRPNPSTDFGAIPPDLNESFGLDAAQTNAMICRLSRKLLLVPPCTLDDYQKALTSRPPNPRSLLLAEAFGSLTHLACDEWSRPSPARRLIADVTADAHDGADEAEKAHRAQVLARFEQFSEDEKAAIEQWWKWYPGRWADKAEANGARKNSADEDAKRVFARLRAWEVALAGYLMYAVRAEGWATKWKVLAALVAGMDGVDTNGDAMVEEEAAAADGDVKMEEAAEGESPAKEEVTNGDANGEEHENGSPNGVNGDGMIEELITEQGQSMSSRAKRKRAALYYSSEEEEDDKEECGGGRTSRRSGRSTRTSSRLQAKVVPKLAKAPSPSPPAASEPPQPVSAPKKKGRPAAKETIVIDALVEGMERGFARLGAAERLSVMDVLLNGCVVGADKVKEHLDICQEKILELKKEKREMAKDHKAVGAALAELEQKEKAIEMVNAEAAAAEAAEGIDSEDDVTRKSKRVKQSKKTIAKQHQRHERERKKEEKKAIEERQKIDDQARLLQERSYAIDLELAHLTMSSRVQPLGRDRHYNAYYWFDLAMPLLTTPAETPAAFAEDGGSDAGGPVTRSKSVAPAPPGFASGLLFVERVEIAPGGLTGLEAIAARK